MKVNVRERTLAFPGKLLALEIMRVRVNERNCCGRWEAWSVRARRPCGLKTDMAFP